MKTVLPRMPRTSLLSRGLFQPQDDERVAFFEEGEIRDLALELSPAQVARIQDPKRPYVHASLFENGRLVFRDVAVKIKGAAGSSRAWGDRPALTINTDKYQKGQSYRGLDKFHLNNSVQDPGLLHEWISSTTFRAAGYAAARVSHARVRLNGRDVGMYVLKEGFDGGFLRAHFAKTGGNLYDGGFVQDIDADLQRDEGEGPEDKADLKALVAACRTGNPAERWKTLATRLDIPSFLTFMAIERMLCHWDGYCLNVNNYRLYFDPAGKGYFLPHGMDQMLGDLNASLFDSPRSLVGSTVLTNPVWRSAYRARIKELNALFQPSGVVARQIPVVAERLAQAQQRISGDAARDQIAKAEDVRRRFLERGRMIAGMLSVGEPPPPQPLRFDDQGVAIPTDWKRFSQVADTKLESGRDPNGRFIYSIKVGRSGVCVASFRSTVIVGPGVYSFQARARTQDVVGLEDDAGSAVGIRVWGGSRTERADGTGEKDLSFGFTVEDAQREVTLAMEMRASKGQVWFDGGTVRLVRIPDPRFDKPAAPPKPVAKPAAKPAAKPGSGKTGPKPGPKAGSRKQ